MLITFGSILATVAVFVLAVTLGTHAQHRFAGFEAMYWPIVPLWASIIGFAFYIWALLAATARRGHDLDQKFRIGRLDIFGLRYLYRRGTTGPNQYGPDPLQKATLPE